MLYQWQHTLIWLMKVNWWAVFRQSFIQLKSNSHLLCFFVFGQTNTTACNREWKISCSTSVLFGIYFPSQDFFDAVIALIQTNNHVNEFVLQISVTNVILYYFWTVIRCRQAFNIQVQHIQQTFKFRYNTNIQTSNY